MRKIAFVLLAALIAVGCGSSDDSEKETSSSMSSTTVIEETTTTEDEYVAPVDEEEDGYEEDDWDGAQQDSDRDTLVFLISGITGEDLGFVNVGFSGCVVDAVAEASGDDYSTALANVYSDDDAYSMEFEAAAISCISYLSAAELARLAEADDASDEDAPTVLDYDPQPVFWTIPEGEECGSQEYGRYIMIDGFCNNADICLDDPGHEACGDPAQYDWTSHACPVSDIHGETVRYGESLCQPIFCINENPSHVLCDDPSNYDDPEYSDEDHSSYDFVGTDCATADSDRKVTPNWPYDSGIHEGPSNSATMRIGTHDDYDRWVLEFREDSTPPTGCDIRWTGEDIELTASESAFRPAPSMSGNKFLTITLKSSNGFYLPEGEQYYGPLNLYGDDIDAFNLVHATSFAEYEGYATWAIGVAYESEFTVGTLSDPARLIIDICH